MQITKIVPQGFCRGVIRAIDIAKETAKNHPNSKIYTLGMLVHNRYVVNDLAKLGIETLDTVHFSKEEVIDRLDSGFLILTAHGTAKEIIQKAQEKGLIIVDATCNDVKKTQNLISDYLEKDYQILYIGKKNHPEAEAMIAINPSKIHLITSPDDLSKLNLPNIPYLITCQTTLSMLDIKQLINLLKSKYPHAVVQSEICLATTQRQNAVLNIRNSDALIVVGDPNSNNSMQLYKLAQTKLSLVKMVENASQINIQDFINCKSVAITSGASTPSYLVEEIISKLSTI